jgi:hypothetical protein
MKNAFILHSIHKNWCFCWHIQRYTHTPSRLHPQIQMVEDKSRLINILQISYLNNTSNKYISFLYFHWNADSEKIWLLPNIYKRKYHRATPNTPAHPSPIHLFPGLLCLSFKYFLVKYYISQSAFIYWWNI